MAGDIRPVVGAQSIPVRIRTVQVAVDGINIHQLSGNVPVGIRLKQVCSRPAFFQKTVGNQLQETVPVHRTHLVIGRFLQGIVPGILNDRLAHGFHRLGRN